MLGAPSRVTLRQQDRTCTARSQWAHSPTRPGGGLLCHLPCANQSPRLRLSHDASGLLGRQPAKSGSSFSQRPQEGSSCLKLEASFVEGAIASQIGKVGVSGQSWPVLRVICELWDQTWAKPSTPLGYSMVLQPEPGPRFQQIGDGDGGEPPIPDKSGTGTRAVTEERPRPRANRGRTPRPRPRTNRGRGRGRGPGCPRPGHDRRRRMHLTAALLDREKRPLGGP